MNKVQNKNSFICSPITTIVLFVLVVIFIISAASMLRKQSITETNKQKALAESEKLENQKKALESETEYLNTEYGVERVLREKFGVVKEGESVVVIVPREDDPFTEDKNNSFEKGILGAFIGLFKSEREL
jgi:cell division protein FtsB